MTFLVEILHHVHALLVSHFKPTWVALTATAALCVAGAVRQAPKAATENEKNHVLVWRQIGTPGGIGVLALLAAFLGSYIAMTLVWKDFTADDDYNILLWPLKGHDIPPPI